MGSLDGLYVGSALVVGDMTLTILALLLNLAVVIAIRQMGADFKYFRNGTISWNSFFLSIRMMFLRRYQSNKKIRDPSAVQEHSGLRG